MFRARMISFAKKYYFLKCYLVLNLFHRVQTKLDQRERDVESLRATIKEMHQVRAQNEQMSTKMRSYETMMLQIQADAHRRTQYPIRNRQVCLLQCLSSSQLHQEAIWTLHSYWKKICFYCLEVEQINALTSIFFTLQLPYPQLLQMLDDSAASIGSLQSVLGAKDQQLSTLSLVFTPCLGSI